SLRHLRRRDADAELVARPSPSEDDDVVAHYGHMTRLVIERARLGHRICATRESTFGIEDLNAGRREHGERLAHTFGGAKTARLGDDCRPFACSLHITSSREDLDLHPVVDRDAGLRPPDAEAVRVGTVLELGRENDGARRRAVTVAFEERQPRLIATDR